MDEQLKANIINADILAKRFNQKYCVVKWQSKKRKNKYFYEIIVLSEKEDNHEVIYTTK
jgi:hypothetical protein